MITVVVVVDYCPGHNVKLHPYCLVCAPNGERLGPPLITVVASARACGVKK
jgi:hypothetical protein